MTLVVCWLQESHGFVRLSAVADGRASRDLGDGKRATITDHVPKLFAVPVKCFASSSLDLGTGAWTQPYYETIVGLGMTGNCFEALAVVAHIQRCFSQLSSSTDAQSMPDGRLLARLALELLDRFIQGHSDKEELTVRFVLFGWTHDGKPWMAKLGWDKGCRDALVHMTAKRSIFLAIGTDPGAAAAAAKQQRLTATKLERSPERKDFDRQLEEALAVLAVDRTAEQAVNGFLKDESWATIGGRLEKLEIIPNTGRPCVARVALAHDREAVFWEALSSVSDDGKLHYTPVVVNFEA